MESISDSTSPLLTFAGRLGIQQRVLPSYRLPFFAALAKVCSGGISVFAGLPRRGEAIRVASGEQLSRQPFHYVQGHNIHLFRGALYFCYQLRLLSWLEQWQPEVLILEANPRYLSTPPAIRRMRQRGRAVIGWGLGAPPLWGGWSKIREQQRRRFLAHFDALIAYSQRGAEEYAHLGFPAERIFVAPNAVAPPPAHPLPSRPPSFLADRPTVLFVGRLQARKRVDYLIRACASLPAERQPRLIIIGDGPAHPALQQLAHQVYPDAEFPGPKYGEELRPYFLTADLFVLPGTGGLAIQEAMAYGLPVIVAKGDGTQQDLVGAGNGWQIPEDNIEALATALNKALSDISRLRKMGAESYRVVSEEINLDKMVLGFLRAIRSVSPSFFIKTKVVVPK